MNENIITVDHSKENPFLMLCRKTIRDIDLDLQAKGLLIFLLDKPYNWRVRPDALAKELGLGKTTICKIMNRLIGAGYIHREVIKRRKDGKFKTGSIYTVFEDKEYRREWIDRSEFERASMRGPDFKDVPF
ncbi:hypothetical protein ES708_04184 [subsurface metagenome]